MAFLDELKDRAMDLGRAGVAKSKQLAEITKLSPEQRQRGGRHQEGVCGDRQAILCRAGHGP